MPIGPISPGSYVEVSSDADPQTVVLDVTISPTATMAMIASDIQNLTLLMLNNDAALSEPARVTTTQYPLASRADNRAVLRAPTHDGFWTYVNGTIQLQAQGTTVRRLSQIIPIPKGNEITEIDVWITGAAGHSAFPGGKPASMPSIRLWEYDPTTATKTQKAPYGTGLPKDDPSVTAGGYESPHTIRFTISDFQGGVAFAPDLTKIYILELTSEGGGGAIAGMEYEGIEVSWTMTKVDPGAA
jgi:hypothetical protein